MNRGIANKACSVFVGNIPYDVDEETLKKVFGTVGPVVSLRLMYDKNTRQPKGFGFCEYRDQETAYAAMRNLNNVEVGGRPLRVDWADHELKSTEGVLRAPGRSTADIVKHSRVADLRLQEFIDKISSVETAEELSSEAITHCEIGGIVNTLSSSQMVSLVGHMLGVIAQGGDVGKQFLTAHPHVSLALMQMCFLLGLSAEPALPMSHDDIAFANERISQLRQSRIAPNKPAFVPHLVNPPMGIMGVGPPPMLPPHLTGMAPPPILPPPVNDQKKILLEQLAKLTPEQIAQLPEEVKKQVLDIVGGKR